MMMNLAELNPQQREAVEYTEGPLLILAGAGSGKTKVLTSRIAYLVEERRVAPWHILAITFTNKAAKEMRNRIINLIGQDGEKIWASTFHSTCVRILRNEIHYLDYDTNFVIYDDADQQTLLKAIIKEKNLDEKKFPAKGAAARISNYKNELKKPSHAYREAYGDYADEQYADIYRLYQERLQKNNAVDFDDLIMLTVELFRNYPEVLERYQERFRYILVDEYQDTNTGQYVLVNLLAGKYRNLCVVGDDDQSIYQWRGADIRNILNFEKDYPDTHVIKLEENYRSTQGILDAAYGVIRHNMGRKDKRLWTAKEGGAKIGYYTAYHESDEAFFICRQIDWLRADEGRAYGDFAVLCRATAQFRMLEETMIKQGIPYRIYGGMKFYSRKEIKDIMAYLKAIANPADEISVERALSTPKRGVGDSSWNKLVQFARENNLTILQAMLAAEESGLSKKYAQIVYSFALLLESFREMSENSEVTPLVEFILNESGYLQALEAEKTVEAETRIENLKEFLSITKAFDLRNDDGEKTLAAFLAEVALFTDLDEMEEDDDAVTIMTMHGAKGLEFPVVFVTGMEEGIFPHIRALQSLEENEMEEERRLCYVALTRAKEKVFLTRANERMLYGKSNYNRASRFISEIPYELIEELQGNGRVKQSSGTAEKTRGLSFSEFMSGNASTTSKTTAASADSTADYQLGDTVRHKKWGDGVVVAVEGTGIEQEIKVAFPDKGIKDLIVQYAPIEKVEN